jgi:hypothetical protein
MLPNLYHTMSDGWQFFFGKCLNLNLTVEWVNSVKLHLPSPPSAPKVAHRCFLELVPVTLDLSDPFFERLVSTERLGKGRLTAPYPGQAEHAWLGEPGQCARRNLWARSPDNSHTVDS